MTIKRKICFAALLTILFLSAVFICVQSAAAAENDNNPVNFAMSGIIESTSTHFEIADSSYLNLTLDSSEVINLRMESAPQMVSMMINPVSNASSTQLTIKGFLPLTTYYKYPR